MELALYVVVSVGVALSAGGMSTKALFSSRRLRQLSGTLEETEERLRLTVHSAGIAVWSWDIAPNAIAADENCAVLFGLPIGQFPQTVEGFAALVHPDDRERVQQEIAASVEDGAEYNTEFRVVWPEGTVRHVGLPRKSLLRRSRTTAPVHGRHLGRDRTPSSRGKPARRQPRGLWRRGSSGSCWKPRRMPWWW